MVLGLSSQSSGSTPADPAHTFQVTTSVAVQPDDQFFNIHFLHFLSVMPDSHPRTLPALQFSLIWKCNLYFFILHVSVLMKAATKLTPLLFHQESLAPRYLCYLTIILQSVTDSLSMFSYSELKIFISISLFPFIP
jgi:hypothetical protein